MIKRTFITTVIPKGNDPGAIEEAWYRVENGMVVMCSETGKPTGQKARSEENPERTAMRLLREAVAKRKGESNFNRQIVYPPWNRA
jgi:hypothetical protein